MKCNAKVKLTNNPFSIPVFKGLCRKLCVIFVRNFRLRKTFNIHELLMLFIVQLEANQHKAKRLQEHVDSVNDWTTSTTVFLDEFNDIAGQLVPSDASGKDKASDVGETDVIDGQGDAVDGDDVEKAKKEREEKINAANEIIHRIAISFLKIASVFTWYSVSLDQ